jgi:TonB family protein
LEVNLNRFVVLAAVAIAHVCIAMLVTGSAAADRDFTAVPLTIEFIESKRVEQDQPAPVAPTPVLSEAVIPLESVEIPLEEDAPTATAVMNSAPVPAAIQPLTADEFAAKFLLALTEEATVVILVEVLADGTVGTVTVDRSSGSALVDTVALEYARELKWIPGFANGEPVATRVRYGVHLLATRAVATN